MTRLRVQLNGTSVNPYHRWGLSQNPIPQGGRAQNDAACLQVQKFGGDPIPNVEYIRETLKGFSKEFIDLCCSQYRPGEYVTFIVTWPEEGS